MLIILNMLKRKIFWWSIQKLQSCFWIQMEMLFARIVSIFSRQKQKQSGLYKKPTHTHCLDEYMAVIFPTGNSKKKFNYLRYNCDVPQFHIFAMTKRFLRFSCFFLNVGRCFVVQFTDTWNFRIFILLTLTTNFQSKEFR